MCCSLIAYQAGMQAIQHSENHTSLNLTINTSSLSCTSITITEIRTEKDKYNEINITVTSVEDERSNLPLKKIPTSKSSNPKPNADTVNCSNPSSGFQNLLPPWDKFSTKEPLKSGYPQSFVTQSDELDAAITDDKTVNDRSEVVEESIVPTLFKPLTVDLYPTSRPGCQLTPSCSY